MIAKRTDGLLWVRFYQKLEISVGFWQNCYKMQSHFHGIQRTTMNAAMLLNAGSLVVWLREEVNVGTLNPGHN